jgi:hypothetical protein
MYKRRKALHGEKTFLAGAPKNRKREKGPFPALAAGFESASVTKISAKSALRG